MLLEEQLKLTAFSNFLKETATYLSARLELNNKPSGFYIGSPIIVVGNIAKNNMYILTFEKILGYTGNCNEVYGRSEGYWSCLIDKEYNDLESLKLSIAYAYDGGRYAEGTYRYAMCTDKTHTLQLYITFWNLFLCTIDDTIYDEQLPIVIELAHCFGFDEHIMRDLCRGVEYVLSGKKLSLECDLHCDTVECTQFFLGKGE